MSICLNIYIFLLYEKFLEIFALYKVIKLKELFKILLKLTDQYYERIIVLRLFFLEQTRNRS